MKSEVTLAKCHEIETKKATHVAFLFVTPGGSGKNLAEWTGLEPATPGVTGRYSNQLNYHSSFRRRARQPRLVGADGIEPPTFAL